MFPGGVRGSVDRIRGSLLPRILVVLASVLVVSSAATFALESRLTHSRLERRGVELLEEDLEILRASLVRDYSDLLTRLRNAGQGLALHGAHAPERRAALMTELGRIRRELGLDLVNTFDRGNEVMAVVGTPLVSFRRPVGDEIWASPVARLVRTADGRYARVALVSVGGEEGFVLAGGHLFDDAAAYRMRGLIGHDVLLLADGLLVGSSLAHPPARPPLVGQDGRIPAEPALVSLNGRKAFVGYAPVAAASDWAHAGTVGVVLRDPVANLDRSLARNRMATAVVLLAFAIGLGWLVFRHLARPLLALSDTARRVAAGDLDAAFAVRSRDEIGRLASSLEEMRRELRTRLEVIRTQSSALRDSSQRIVDAQDAERRRLAGDLHDGLQQRLVMLRLQAGRLAGRLSHAPEADRAEASALAEGIEAVVEELREISQAIFPSILADRGLSGALHSLSARAPIPVQVTTVPDPLPRLDGTLEANVYFLISEALANALKHAAPSRVGVGAVLNDHHLEVRIADDGPGWKPDEDGDLTRLRDRAWAAGGNLVVGAAAGGGTEVRAVFRAGDADVRPSSAGGRRGPQPPGG